MRVSTKARMNRMFTHGACLDVAIDHGVCNEPSFLVGLEDMAGVTDSLIKAKPDAIQCAYGQADLLHGGSSIDRCVGASITSNSADPGDVIKQCE